MRFAHLADCHIGGWREPRLKDIGSEAFSQAIDICVERNVDFVLIAGDLFNTSMPGIDGLKVVAIKLRELKEKGIKVYAIAGSHDYSPSGKTMVEVLENAGLLVNIVKGEIIDNRLRLNFTVDERTGAKIAGIFGRKGMLDRKIYEDLVRENLEREKGFKIFMFHTALSEFKPKELEKMDAAPLSLLPKGFDYYAGGHVHYVKEFNEKGYKNIVYPGPIFPNNFRELELLQTGGFYIYNDGELEFIPLRIKNVFSIEIDCNGKSVDDALRELDVKIKRQEFLDAIVTLRFSGRLAKGKPSDLDFKEIFKKFYDKGAYFVMRSTYNLESSEFEEVKIDTVSVEDAEEKIIKEHLGQIKVTGWNADTERKMIKLLMSVFEAEKNDGEKVMDFEKRITKDAADAIDKI